MQLIPKRNRAEQIEYLMRSGLYTNAKEIQELGEERAYYLVLKREFGEYKEVDMMTYLASQNGILK